MSSQHHYNKKTNKNLDISSLITWSTTLLATWGPLPRRPLNYTEYPSFFLSLSSGTVTTSFCETFNRHTETLTDLVGTQASVCAALLLHKHQTHETGCGMEAICSGCSTWRVQSLLLPPHPMLRWSCNNVWRHFFFLPFLLGFSALSCKKM